MSFPVPKKVDLDENVLQTFEIAKVFKDNTARINAMDFDATGDLLVTSSDDESLHLYDVNAGKLKKTVFAKKYGVNLVRFTHHPNAIIVASKNSSWDDSIRYLSLHDNRYLRYFKGHRNQVVSLEISPVDDTFLSGGLDNSIRLWDLRTNACQGLIRISGRPAVAYDPQGLIFAIATGTNVIKLYDVRSYDKGPFATFHVEGKPVEWGDISFSPDGNFILLTTLDDKIFLLDAFEGHQKTVYGNHAKGSVLDAGFSPDGQFMLTGSEEGLIYAYNALDGRQITKLKGEHSGTSVPVLRWNPTKMMLASGDNAGRLAFWLPKD